MSERYSAANTDQYQTTQRLADHPNLRYLLREFETLYRYGSSGGSPAIRRHRRIVRDRLSSTVSTNPSVVERAAEAKPVTAHMTRALDLAERGAMRDMAKALREVRPSLTWEYGYERIPQSLARKYAYCEVLGPRGPVVCDRLILGFVLFAPGTTYPQHSHDEIEESYISVSGEWSENDAAVYAPGSLILNRSGTEHRITTGAHEPCLLAYAWAGEADRLNDPQMKLTKPRKEKARRPG